MEHPNNSFNRFLNILIKNVLNKNFIINFLKNKVLFCYFKNIYYLIIHININIISLIIFFFDLYHNFRSIIYSLLLCNLII